MDDESRRFFGTGSAAGHHHALACWYATKSTMVVAAQSDSENLEWSGARGHMRHLRDVDHERTVGDKRLLWRVAVAPGARFRSTPYVCNSGMLSG